ncbi:hypothetical protein J5N97_004193 [Dioscorea zingiberensis]|uniref:Uncharacterized protein n=1 Tax=Dioscorea zingiberensis TaxID=325984 RepID=A0A9D5D7E7_9LILI|nr:hypothetical protein J5N97_004193 [Dioscorea zingiberensis]
MGPKLQKAFVHMKELEKGAIANLDTGRIVGHYWLRNPKMVPNLFLRLQIENTPESICDFTDQIISRKIKPPSSLEGRLTQVLSVGIGCSAPGPQFVTGALVPDNPPLKSVVITQENFLLDNTARIEVKNSPAALLVLCWYWASDGVRSKDMVVLP